MKKSFIQRAFRSISTKNGELIPCIHASHTNFLLEFPKASYTVMRTVEQRFIYSYNNHITRLANNMEPIMTFNEMNTFVKPYIASSLQLATSSDDNVNIEFRVTVVISNDTNVYIHVSALPYVNRMAENTKVWVESMVRNHGQTKNTEWTRISNEYKQRLKDAGDVEELLMYNTQFDGITEGLSSNFFIVCNNTVVTADADVHGVLKGTVRTIVIDICKELNIPVVYKCQPIDTCDEWDGCFITSTSRLLLPIYEMNIRNYHNLKQDKMIKFKYAEESLVKTLEKAVLNRIRNDSQDIFGDVNKTNM